MVVKGGKCLSLSFHRGFHGIQAVSERHPWGEEWALKILDSSGSSMAPNAPFLLLAKPHKLLDHDVFGAVLLLSRCSVLSFQLRALGIAVVRGQLNLARGLTTSDTQHDLTHTGVGNIWDLRCAVRNDTNAAKECCWSAVVFVQGPSHLFVLRAVGNSSAEIVGKAGTTDLSQGRDVSSVAKPIGLASEVGKQGSIQDGHLLGKSSIHPLMEFTSNLPSLPETEG